MIIIFTHQRYDRCVALVDELLSKFGVADSQGEPEEPYILILEDTAKDGIRYPKIVRNGVIHQRFAHQGKQNFWKLWSYAVSACYRTTYQTFMFLPDDFSDLETDEILSRSRELSVRGPYVYNVINDGRPPQWTTFQPGKTPYGESVGWTDCGFFCNRAALEALDFIIQPIDPLRFYPDPDVSSGVGQQLTQRFGAKGVPMYRPYKSLAYHGDHESVMHPEERKRNPIISR